MSAPSEPERLGELGVLRLRAANAGPLTLSGTNTWVVGRDPAWVVDPGPALPEHLDSLHAAIAERGGLGGIALTHHHIDHSEAVALLRERAVVPLAAGRAPAEVQLREGVRFGPLEAIHTPGHTPDHFAFVFDRVCFTGDAVLGEGSVFIASDDRNALAGYLDGLSRLRARDFEVLCPGHGPPIWAPVARLSDYVEHRLERERRLVAALAEGRRSTEELLDAAWSDVPEALRPMAAITLTAHLDKLAGEGRLPEGVRPAEG
ncbi:MAG TPA: MBL fold metallo-hydrolase [Solirubrobacteraceae bacterium]|jgi:glyoxylase-like metal-dependent hydrolase (beta-lactamase superfamily II)